ncbi:MAG: hypothetical protein NTY71_01300 [Methanoregula sp.]|jgi:hypothetical protein|nr:hypothetical protein [Methanoregula sp.]
MYAYTNETTLLQDITLAPEVLDYIAKRDCDFRICTSCGGPILLPTRVKPPKKSDFLFHAGNHTIYISIHQARYLHTIRMDLVPFFDDSDLFGNEDR